jgi:hypothetical protein
LKNKGKQAMVLRDGEQPKLSPLTETGSGSVQEKEKALITEIISKVNDLFDGELTDDDKLVYVNNVIKGKLLESEVLVQQATNNTKEQFANSPDLANGILNAIMDAFAAHSTMSKQALDSEKVRSGLKDVLLGPAQLKNGYLPKDLWRIWEVDITRIVASPLIQREWPKLRGEFTSQLPDFPFISKGQRLGKRPLAQVSTHNVPACVFSSVPCFLYIPPSVLSSGYNIWCAKFYLRHTAE